MTVQAAAALAGAVIADLVIDPATTVADLNASLRENKPTIDWIGTIAPEIWQQLKLRTQSRRAQLARAAA